MSEPENGRWAVNYGEFAGAVLREMGGLEPVDASMALAALEQAGLLIPTRYWVPTADDLYGMYATLGAAYLNHRIDVRWVMCAETHDALAKRYGNQRYPIMPDQMTLYTEDQPVDHDGGIRAGTVMVPGIRWGDKSALFGIPIRIDPAARRPMFEIVGKDDTPA